MTQNEDYRRYLEEKFEGLTKHIHAQFSNVQDVLERIEKQTTKTNSRVDKLETKITDIEKGNLKHLTDCPQVPKIEKINSDLEEYRMLKKYPKFAVIVIAIVVIGAVYGFYKMTNTVNITKEELTNEIRLMEGVSKVNRDGYVKFNNNGLKDSIKLK
jgi:hypothetical protein